MVMAGKRTSVTGLEVLFNVVTTWPDGINRDQNKALCKYKMFFATSIAMSSEFESHDLLISPLSPCVPGETDSKSKKDKGDKKPEHLVQVASLLVKDVADPVD